MGFFLKRTWERLIPSGALPVVVLATERTRARVFSRIVLKFVLIHFVEVCLLVDNDVDKRIDPAVKNPHEVENNLSDHRIW